MWPGPGFSSGAAEGAAVGLRPARQGWGPSVPSSLAHTLFLAVPAVLGGPLGPDFWGHLW